jgi:formylmethanofuran dehydrogenase subunit B
MNLAPADRVERHLVCLGCGCACDDLEVTDRDQRIMRTSPACAQSRSRMSISPRPMLT